MAPPRPLYREGDLSVTHEKRGHTSVLRFAGAPTPAFLDWLPKGLRECKPPVALHLRRLAPLDDAAVEKVAAFLKDCGRKKGGAALVDAPLALVRKLRELGRADDAVLLSGEAALGTGGSLLDAAGKDREAAKELASRFQVNPLWRRVDQDQVWLCPLCGTPVDDVLLPDVLKPDADALRGARGHLTERCAAARAGRQTPLPASMLDAFLFEVNKRKSRAAAEHKTVILKQMTTLRERVESMEEIEKSVEQAKERQLHLLPIEPKPDDVAEIAVVYRPLQSVSGDFLDFYSLEDNRFGVAIGDVSGHGVEAAIIMGMAKMALRIRSQALGTVAERMTYANRDLYRELQRTAFVTCFFGLIDRGTRRLSYVRAGHPPPLLRRSGTSRTLDGNGLPFGADEGKRFAAGLEEKEIQLAPGDVVLLYTDGVTEAGTPEQFGEQRLQKALLAAPADAPAQAILASVVGALDAYLAGTPLSDDVTLICLRIR